ncbi:hypothetical protein GGU45_000438 [Niabella hirudinis]
MYVQSVLTISIKTTKILPVAKNKKAYCCGSSGDTICLIRGGHGPYKYECINYNL